MEKAIWERWVSRMHWISERVRAKGGEVEGPEIWPPVSLSQAKEFKHITGLSLPEDFVEMITKFSGGFRFAWSLDDCNDLRKDFPVSGGNWEVPFIGVSEQRPLVEVYLEFQKEFREGALNWIYHAEFDHHEDIRLTRHVLPYCFPLYVFYGNGGDFLVLRFDVEPSQVLYLDHEWGFSVRGRALIGKGLREFMETWSKLGYPEVDRYSVFFDEDKGMISAENKVGQEWIRWLEEE